MSTTLTPPAESSPAPIAAPETMMLPQGADREAFLKTGDLPAAEKIPDAKPGESSAPESKSAEGEQPKEKGAPASEAGKTKQERPNADTRKVELSSEIEDLLQRRHKMRTEIEEMETRLKSAKPDSQPEAKTPPVQRDPREPVEPDQNDPKYKTWGEYESDLRKYNRDYAAFASTKAVDDFQAKQRLDAQTNELKGKVDAATARYGEESGGKIIQTAGSIFTDAKVPDVIKEILNSSDVLPDLLYAIGGDEKNLTDFLNTARTNLPLAIRKLNAVETLVIQELAKAEKTERAPDGKFVAPEKKQTSAPPPPREVGGERAALPDELDEAFKEAERTGDARKLIDLENQRFLKRRRGQ